MPVAASPGTGEVVLERVVGDGRLVIVDAAVDLCVLDSPDSDTVRLVVSNLVAANETVAPPEEYQPLAVVARVHGDLVGGAVGHTHWGWLFVSHLWVDVAQRGVGLGSALMASIEDAARRRDVGSAHVDTYDFQALGFYERLGYAVFGKLDDFPVGHTRFFLQKSLT